MEQDQTHGQEHPISTYFWIWGLLFVLSAFSYMVDILGFESYTRWTLILVFMLSKAGLIVAIFMHMAWEKTAIIYAILLPTAFILVFVSLMMLEADNTHLVREIFFSSPL
ncbi:MAG: cytochrome C oxidase subunit IV family protein [Sneathiella sp.]|nr:cytochrome C oxidase subunit IV family protein [Sneathiella sp.]